MKIKVTFLLCIFYALNCNSQNNNIEKSGDILLYAIPISTATATIILNDDKGTWQFAKGFLLNAITTEGMKYFIHKERPNGFDDKSFPSGHTSITFQSAAFIQKRYGWKFGIPAYLLSSYTGYSRIQSKNHFFIDVLSGALIGIGSSYIFTTKYTKNVQVALLKDNLTTSIVINLSF